MGTATKEMGQHASITEGLQYLLRRWPFRGLPHRPIRTITGLWSLHSQGPKLGMCRGTHQEGTVPLYAIGNQIVRLFLRLSRQFYGLFVSRAAGAASRVNMTTSSPVTVLMS